jgi:glycosyltransferase involved in cell wall biosynthesis
MKNNLEKAELKLFLVSLIIPAIIYRVVISLSSNTVSPLRTLTGLSFHHLHYGIILLTISLLILLFNKKNKLTFILSGIGFSLTLDSFIPSLLLKTERGMELVAYNRSLLFTVILFIVVILITMVMYRKR